MTRGRSDSLLIRIQLSTICQLSRSLWVGMDILFDGRFINDEKPSAQQILYKREDVHG